LSFHVVGWEKLAKRSIQLCDAREKRRGGEKKAPVQLPP